MHLLVLLLKHILINGISCKKVVFCLQYCAFTSINSETYTNKWNIYLAKKSFSFLQDFAFISILYLYFMFFF